MRQNVGHAIIRTPPRLVNVEPVLLESREIDNPKIGTARGDLDFPEFLKLPLHFGFLRRVSEIQQIAGIGVVWSRFADVVEPGPDKFAGDEREFVLTFELGVGRRSPRRSVKVIGANLEIRPPLALVVVDGEEIFAARTDAGGGLAAEERLVWIGLAEFAILAWFVIVTEDIELFLETVVA